MRFVVTLLLFASACAKPSSIEPRREATAAAAAGEAATIRETKSPAPDSVAPRGPALFVYQEGDDTLSFVAPRTVSLLRGKDAGGIGCTGELPDQGNPYSGGDVLAAFRDSEVQQAIAQSSVFLSADLPVQGELRASAGRIRWTPACGGLCFGGPKGVTALLRVLQVVMSNQRAVCG